MTVTKYNAKALGLAVALCVPLASCVSVQKHEQLNRKARRVEANNAALTQDLAKRTRVVTDLKAKVNELTQDVTLSEGALEQRRYELGNAQQKIDELRGSLAQFKTTIDEERRTVQRYQQKAIDLTAERDSALKNAHHLTEQLNQTTTEVKNLSTRTRALAALRDSLVQKITRLSAAKSTLEDNFAALIRKRDELNALVTSLGQKVAQQDEAIENNSIERGRLNTLSQSLRDGATTQKIALQKLRTRLTQTALSLEQARTEKQTLQNQVDAGKKELSEKTAQLEEQRRKVAGKLVVEPYWKWIFAAVAGLGALGWVWGKFKA